VECSSVVSNNAAEDVLVSAVLCDADLPRVSAGPAEVSLARGLPGRLDCPTTANPPVTRVLWSKNDRVVAPLVPNHSEAADDDPVQRLRVSVVIVLIDQSGWLGSRVVSVLDSGAEGPGFKSQPRRCRVTVLGKLFTPIVPLFTKQQNWQHPS